MSRTRFFAALTLVATLASGFAFVSSSSDETPVVLAGCCTKL